MKTIGKGTSNPAAFGWTWVEPASGSEWQLAYARGGNTLTLGMRPKGATKWAHLGPISEPQRFLMGGHPTTVKAWRAVVDRWFAAAEEQ